MNILISVDQNYLDKAKTMLFSLSMHTNERVFVYLMNHRLSKSEVVSFAEYMMNLCNIQVIEINVKNTELDSFPLGDFCFTVEMYYRILAQFLLPQEVKRVLWLDCDIIVLNSVDTFYNQDFNGAKYVVCADRDNNTDQVIKQKKRLNLPAEHKYFNSGVMLMNLSLLRETTDRNKIVSTIESVKNDLLFPDQDALNILYNNQVKYADGKKYNFQVKNDKCIPDNQKDKIAILHYCGKKKPWIYWCIDDVAIYYWKVRAKLGKKEKKESKNVYRNKIIESLIDLKKYIKYYFSI